MLRIIESILLALFFGFLPVLVFVAAAGFLNVMFLEEKGIAYWALGGLGIGLIIDCFFVKDWITKAYQMNSKGLAAIYLFYSVLAIGMGMGMPVLNLALGIAAGVYSARKMHYIGADEESRHRDFKKMAVFCAAAMVMVCCLMALWAAVGGMIGSRFETPIVSFTFTLPVFLAVLITGGAALVLLQYCLTMAAAKATFRLSGVRPNS